MVERLKIAIEKARAQRDGAPETPQKPAFTPGTGAASTPVAEESAPLSAVDGLWQSLKTIEISAGHLEKQRVVTRDKSDLAHIPFDLLRTRLMKVLCDNNWKRIAITSPTKGCGKTVVATNLAFSLARQSDIRAALIDMDLRAPGVASTIGVKDVPTLEWYLNGKTSVEATFSRIGDNLALALNGDRVRKSTELIQSERARKQLESAITRLDPDVVIYDLPPMMACDDAIAFMGNVDCVLVVVGGGDTTAREIEECERMIAGSTNFLGVLLNKGEDRATRNAYEYS